ncbi:zinc finger protein 37A-like [Neocloeon triangulifer]|uniref:zinc finger protein 37A-like n=1 Tax=Neocloeon triangulifer TaxID=2078957 RepID=UPI00286F96DF|nr:zinc finger protein 37A-like [Neocloeon triangulifer]
MWLGTGRIKTAAELPTLSTIKKEADISNAENEPEVKAEPVRMQKHFRLNKVKVEKDEKPQEAFLHKIKTEVIEVDPDKRMLKETTEPTKQELKLKDIKLFTGPVKFLPIQPLPLEHVIPYPPLFAENLTDVKSEPIKLLKHFVRQHQIEMEKNERHEVASNARQGPNICPRVELPVAQNLSVIKGPVLPLTSPALVALQDLLENIEVKFTKEKDEMKEPKKPKFEEIKPFSSSPKFLIIKPTEEPKAALLVRSEKIKLKHAEKECHEENFNAKKRPIALITSPAISALQVLLEKEKVVDIKEKYEVKEPKKLKCKEIKPFSGSPKFLIIKPTRELKAALIVRSEKIESEESKEGHCKENAIAHEIITDTSGAMDLLPTKEEVADIKPFTGPVKFLSIKPLPRKHNKKFTCDICKKGVGTKGGLKYHIQAHLFGRPFKCDICKRSYATKNDFDTHNKRHLGKNVICNYCQKQFPVKSYLGDHILMKHLPRELCCQLCSKPRYFQRKWELEKHLTDVHNSDLKCKICNQVYKLGDLYRRHCEQRKLLKYECKECKLKFPCMNLLSDHLKEKRKKQAQGIECPKCMQKVIDLKHHMRFEHSNVKCDICLANFPRNQLYCHKKRCGTDEQIRALGFHCKFCTLYFRTKRAMSNHLNTNHGVLPCPKCTKKFQTKGQLSSHIRESHNLNKYPFTCIICDVNKNFSSKERFNSHFNRTHRFPFIMDRGQKLNIDDIHACDRCKS